MGSVAGDHTGRPHPRPRRTAIPAQAGIHSLQVIGDAGVTQIVKGSGVVGLTLVAASLPRQFAA